MKNSLLLVPTFIFAAAAASLSIAEGGFKYKKLDPADPPCLFLLDENSGEPTGDPVNPPCELGGTVVNPGDSVDPVARIKFGRAAQTSESVQITGNSEPNSR